MRKQAHRACFSIKKTLDHPTRHPLVPVQQEALATRHHVAVSAVAAPCLLHIPAEGRTVTALDGHAAVAG